MSVCHVGGSERPNRLGASTVDQYLRGEWKVAGHVSGRAVEVLDCAQNREGTTPTCFIPLTTKLMTCCDGDAGPHQPAPRYI